MGRHRPHGPQLPARDDGVEDGRRCRWSSRPPGWRSAADARSRCTRDRVQAAAESYIGLVEVGRRPDPRRRRHQGDARRARWRRCPIRTATSCRTCSACSRRSASPRSRRALRTRRRLGYLRDVDAITMNRERVVADAKRTALARAAAGYQPPALRPAIPVGGPDVYAALALGIHLARRAERISDHDATIGRHLARILSGGDVEASHRRSSEQQMLDLEREAFLKLTGEPKDARAHRLHAQDRKDVEELMAAVIVSAVRTAGRQGAARRAALYPSRRNGRGRHARGARPRTRDSTLR